MIYRAAALIGVGSEECDRSEIWVLASQLGGNEPDEDFDPLADDDGLPWGARRARAAALGEPMPKWEDVPLTAREKSDQEALFAMLPPIGPTTLPDTGGGPS